MKKCNYKWGISLTDVEMPYSLEFFNKSLEIVVMDKPGSGNKSAFHQININESNGSDYFPYRVFIKIRIKDYFELK